MSKVTGITIERKKKSPKPSSRKNIFPRLSFVKALLRENASRPPMPSTITAYGARTYWTLHIIPGIMKRRRPPKTMRK